MEKKQISVTAKLIIGVLTGGLLFLTGVYLGYENQPPIQKVTELVNKEMPAANADESKTDFSPFWKAWNIMNEKFPGAAKTSSDDRMYGAIKGMLASFKDPYTTFFTPAETKVFEGQIAGEFSGIGAELGQKDGVLTIVSPLKDTPADKAGLQAGDKIIKIDNTITANLDVDKAIDLIRGEEGTAVSLTIIREGFTEPKVFSVTRSKIALPTVDTETRADQKVFVIHLYNFSANSAQLFYDAFNKFLQSGYPNLLIDLRDNPGGYLDSAVSIGGLFLPEGTTIVKEVGKTASDVTVHTSKGPDAFPKGDKLIILANKGSASASEILAGALSEQGVGILVGEKTFGKGSVQEVIKLTPDTSLKVTVAKWYTPHDVSISETGLTPSILIPNNTTDAKHDTVLEAAVALFAKQ